MKIRIYYSQSPKADAEPIFSILKSAFLPIRRFVTENIVKPWHGIPREEIRWNPEVDETLCIGCGIGVMDGEGCFTLLKTRQRSRWFLHLP